MSTSNPGEEVKPKGQTADGLYVCPIKPINEAVKLALRLPVKYLFVQKNGNRLYFYQKQVR